jgi:hypothetical protein
VASKSIPAKASAKLTLASRVIFQKEAATGPPGISLQVNSGIIGYGKTVEDITKIIR